MASRHTPSGPAMMRILITGSRNWTDYRAIAFDLHGLLDEHGRYNLVVVHGACPRGADAMAEGWAQRWNVKTEPHPADWERYGRSRAGFIRNAEMVALGANLCLAYAMPCAKRTCSLLGRHDSHGTADCIERARAAGVTVRVRRPS